MGKKRVVYSSPAKSATTVDDWAAAFDEADKVMAQRKQEPGLRYDGGKPRYDLIPIDGLIALTDVYTKGAEKYADRNWEKGMSWSRVYRCILSHTFKFMMGESYDEETGCHHMAMAAWNCLALCVYDLRKIEPDDRVPVATYKNANEGN